MKKKIREELSLHIGHFNYWDKRPLEDRLADFIDRLLKEERKIWNYTKHRRR